RKKGTVFEVDKCDIADQPKLGDRNREGDRLRTGRVVRCDGCLAKANATVRPGQIASLLSTGEIGDVVKSGDRNSLTGEGRRRDRGGWRVCQRTDLRRGSGAPVQGRSN